MSIGQARGRVTMSAGRFGVRQAWQSSPEGKGCKRNWLARRSPPVIPQDTRHVAGLVRRVGPSNFAPEDEPTHPQRQVRPVLRPPRAGVGSLRKLSEPLIVSTGYPRLQKSLDFRRGFASRKRYACRGSPTNDALKAPAIRHRRGKHPSIFVREARTGPSYSKMKSVHQ